MSEKNYIEKLFRDALGKIGAPPPKDSKTAIEKKLIEAGLLKEDNSSKRTFFWLIGIIAFISISVTAGYLVINKNKNSAPIVTASDEEIPVNMDEEIKKQRKTVKYKNRSGLSGPGNIQKESDYDLNEQAEDDKNNTVAGENLKYNYEKKEKNTPIKTSADSINQPDKNLINDSINNNDPANVYDTRTEKTEQKNVQKRNR